MDAEGTVGDTVSELKQHDMSTYTTKKGSYIVPYTSLVTSSMMGKSRHMQTILPCVYLCIGEEDRGYGYPRRSPSIAEWSLTGAATILGGEPKEFDFYLSTFR